MRGKYTRRFRTPTVLQMESVECGAAALGVVLGYYGRAVPLAELRQECAVSSHGVSAREIVRAARRYGLEARGVKLPPEGLPSQPGPTIVHWEFNHFVVVDGFGADKVYLNDPASGARTVSLAEFNVCYTGVALLLRPGPEFRPGGRRSPVWSLLTGPLRRYWSGLATTAVAGFLLVVPGLAVPVFTQIFIDALLLENRDNWLQPLLLGLALVGCFQAALVSIQRRAQRRLRLQLAVTLSSRFLWHVLRLPVNYFTHRYGGEISTRTALTDQVADFVAGPLAGAAIQLLLVGVYAALMAVYDPVLTGLVVVVAALNVSSVWRAVQRLTDFQARLQQEDGKLGGLAVAGLQNIETLKASAQEGGFFTSWAGLFTRTLLARQDLELTSFRYGLAPVALSALAQILVLVVGGLRVMDGRLSIGMLVAFQGLMANFQAPLAQLTQLVFKLQEIRIDLLRLDDVLATAIDPEAERPRLPPSETPCRRLTGLVELRGVTFGYSRVDPPLVENLSLTIRPGERVALVGASGSGKSTIAKLVAGLYEPWTGEICFDGRPRCEFPRALLAHCLAYVEQDLAFFGGTVEDNLTLWDRSVTAAALVRGSQDALIHDVIRALPGGYASDLLEGGRNLSGGERQRLEIARALIRDPAVLILDEATNSLDAEMESRLETRLRGRRCTCLVIAHRLSTVRDCDQILVLRAGRVVEQGRHEELMQAAGEYARLVRSEGEGASE